MRKVIRVQTADGQLHESEKDARRHAERLYGDALSTIAHRVSRLEKYSAVMDFIDANLADFLALAELKRDIVFTGQNPEDE